MDYLDKLGKGDKLTLNDTEKNRCKDLLTNKDIYLSLYMKENPELGTRLASLYEVFTNKFTIYYRDLLDSGLAAAETVKAYKTHKVDPYIAGGAAQGLAGVGAGITTALSASERNKQIDAWRSESASRSSDAKYRSSVSEKNLLESLTQLEALINESDSIKQYRLEEKRKQEEEANKRKIESEATQRRVNKAIIASGAALLAIVVVLIIVDSINTISRKPDGFIGVVIGIGAFVIIGCILMFGVMKLLKPNQAVGCGTPLIISFIAAIAIGVLAANMSGASIKKGDYSSQKCTGYNCSKQCTYKFRYGLIDMDEYSCEEHFHLLQDEFKKR